MFPPSVSQHPETGQRDEHASPYVVARPKGVDRKPEQEEVARDDTHDANHPLPHRVFRTRGAGSAAVTLRTSALDDKRKRSAWKAPVVGMTDWMGRRSTLGRTEAGDSFIVDVSPLKVAAGVGFWAVGMVAGISEGGLGGIALAIGSGVGLAGMLWMFLSPQPALVVNTFGVNVRGTWLGWEEVDAVEMYESQLPWYPRLLRFYTDPDTLVSRDPSRIRRWLRRRSKSPTARTALGIPLMFLNRPHNEILEAVEKSRSVGSTGSPA